MNKNKIQFTILRKKISKKFLSTLFSTVLFCFLFNPYTGVAIENLTEIRNDSKSESIESVNLYFFWGEGCPHCTKQKPFLQKMTKKYPELKVHEFEIWNSAKNRDLMIKMGKELNANIGGIPFTVVGENFVVGWMDEKNTGEKIESFIKCSIENRCRDIGKSLIEGEKIESTETSKQIDNTPETITLPIIGEINTANLSLPVITIIIAALDGFNPCAMWALIFLIGLLFGMKNKSRMWILGTAFIVASATAYFLFLTAWLNLLLFIGFIFWIRIIIGIISLAGGGYYLKEFFFNKNAECHVSKNENRKKIMEKLKQLTHENHFFLALSGIILLAFAVNLIELICSAGLPAVYTQILAMNNLPTWQYYAYLLLYILIFLLDDLIVFFIAMTTLKISGISTKFVNLSHLIGGMAMLIIGLLLIFKPEYLMFG